MSTLTGQKGAGSARSGLNSASAAQTGGARAVSSIVVPVCGKGLVHDWQSLCQDANREEEPVRRWPCALGPDEIREERSDAERRPSGVPRRTWEPEECAHV